MFGNTGTRRVPARTPLEVGSPLSRCTASPRPEARDRNRGTRPPILQCQQKPVQSLDGCAPAITGPKAKRHHKKELRRAYFAGARMSRRSTRSAFHRLAARSAASQAFSLSFHDGASVAANSSHAPEWRLGHLPSESGRGAVCVRARDPTLQKGSHQRAPPHTPHSFTDRRSDHSYQLVRTPTQQPWPL